MEGKSLPRYRTLGFTTSKPEEEHPWFSLDIQLHTSRYRIYVLPSNFGNSAVRSDEFQNYLALLLSEHGQQQDDSFDETDGEEADVPNRPDLYYCFDWAVTPCLAAFESLSPAPPPLESEQLALSHFLDLASFECDLTATDDVLAPGEVERVDSYEDRWPSPSSEDAWTTCFPSFSLTEIAVICEDPEHPFDASPTRIRIGQQQLYFKERFDLDDEVAKREVKTYERIAGANFGPSVRTSRLYGVARNARNQLVGLLLYPIDEDSLLTFAVGPETPDALKDRWARQIRDTIAALHQAGITWGDAKPDNVLIDVHGDAYIIDFGGGQT